MIPIRRIKEKKERKTGLVFLVNPSSQTDATFPNSKLLGHLSRFFEEILNPRWRPIRLRHAHIDFTTHDLTLSCRDHRRLNNIKQ